MSRSSRRVQVSSPSLCLRRAAGARRRSINSRRCYQKEFVARLISRDEAVEGSVSGIHPGNQNQSLFALPFLVIAGRSLSGKNSVACRQSEVIAAGINLAHARRGL